jgi:dihydroneopterin aldolase
MPAPRQGLTVVKLGGSFAFSPQLPAILDKLADTTAPVVIVPGGGPFANAVRQAQPRMGFDDSAAHRMALLAMAQFAEAVASHHPVFQTAADCVTIRRTLFADKVPVWSPWPYADGLEMLPESWHLTSDSLSAWLAGQLGANRLLLLKHCDPLGGTSLGEAAQAGIVDPFFPHFAMRSELSVFWLGPSRLVRLAAVLDGRDTASPLLAEGTGEPVEA